MDTIKLKDGTEIEIQQTEVKITEFDIYIDVNGKSCIQVMIDMDYDTCEPSHTYTRNVPARENSEPDEFRFGINSIGITSFGLLAAEPRFRPGGGGLWSSNSHFAEEVTGITQTEITLIDNRNFRMASHMTIKALDELIESKGYIMAYGKEKPYSSPRWYPLINHCSRHWYPTIESYL